MKRKLSAGVFFAAAAMLVWAASAGAVDGTIEINQAKVLANGGTFPYVISSANNFGSFRLTGNLTPPASTDAIDVNAGVNHVTIDLNGFAIVGGGGAAGNGINGSGAGALTVENGTVTGFAAGNGVWTGNNGTVKNVHATSSTVGIVTGDNSVIQGCTANGNSAGFGIECDGSGCVISGNTANSNGTAGIYCGAGCVMSGNTANSNAGVGIDCNGSGGCLITGNTILSNGSNGIYAGDATSGYGNNVLNGNGAGISGGTSMGAGNTNLCSGKAC